MLSPNTNNVLGAARSIARVMNFAVRRGMRPTKEKMKKDARARRSPAVRAVPKRSRQGPWVRGDLERPPRKSLSGPQSVDRAADHAAAAGNPLDAVRLIAVADLAAAIAGERMQVFEREVEELHGAGHGLVRETLLRQNRIAPGNAEGRLVAHNIHPRMLSHA